ncbi:hypothetical protein RIF29_33837 [Crotalaria pallida]|uniref:RNase H type-1 domain-containing protein n=1 Tax=Crotalaria pallida TaxID=3830 RepID=A0AAN9EB19_CROPI
MPWFVIPKYVSNYLRVIEDKIDFSSNAHIEQQIIWHRPSQNWVCINTDGASRHGESARCGGLIHEGLKLAKSKGILRIILEMDSLDVIQMINGALHSSNASTNLVLQIRKLIFSNWEVKNNTTLEFRRSLFRAQTKQQQALLLY